MADEQTQAPSVFGKDLNHSSVLDYEGHEDYQGQGYDADSTRVIKHLQYPWLVEATNTTYSDGPPILKERVAKRGEEVTLEELGPLAVERGERLGSFFTDAELEHLKRGGASAPAELEAGEDVNFHELGEHELAEHLEQNKPNVQDTVALAEDNPETAARLLEAEKIATKGVPRAGVEQGLASIIQRGQQS